MKLRRVDPQEIKVPEVRVTAQFDPETLELFRSSIKEVGIVAPLICCEVDGAIVLVDGLHRLKEALDNKQPKVHVAVIPGDMVDVLTRNIFLDHLRGKTPVAEMVTVIAALWKEFNLDSEAIAAKTGMSRVYVEKLQLISQLTPACREALDQERIKVGHAAALTRVKDPVRQEMVLQQQLLYRWSVKDLEEYIKEVLKLVGEQAEEAPSREERKPAKVRCAYCGGEFDASEVACPTTCRECSGVMFATMAEAKREWAREQSASNNTPGG